MNQLERVLRKTRSNRLARKYPHPRVTVAIPVCNEVQRLARCVEALADQRDLGGSRLPQGLVRVVLLTNGCTDGTFELIESEMERWRVALSVLDVHLPAAHRNAGCARRLANHAAIDLLPEHGGLLFMTDADSCAPPDWIAKYSILLRAGYDAVAGLVDLNRDDCGEIPASLCQRGALEDRYTQLLDQLDSTIDPVPHDPWPRHYNASGANIAVRVDALRGIEDFPRVSCGEDRLFIQCLEAHGRRVRHDCDTRVHTSGRLFGRAAGGMADTMRHRMKAPETPCDPRMEFVDRAYFRACLRAEIRRYWNDGQLAARLASLRDRLGCDADVLVDLPHAKAFEHAWQRLENASPRLERRALSPAQLPLEIQRAEQLLRGLARSDAERWRDESQELTA